MINSSAFVVTVEMFYLQLAGAQKLMINLFILLSDKAYEIHSSGEWEGLY